MGRMNVRRRLRALVNQSGMSIVEVTMAAALFGVVALGVASMIATMGSMQGAGNIKNMLASNKAYIENLVKNDKSWKRTIEHSINVTAANMDCLKPKGSCTDTRTSGTAFALIQSDGEVFFDGTGTDATKTGFNRSGQACTYTGTRDCPINYSLRWYATCRDALPTCPNPGIRVVATPQIPSAVAEEMKLTVNMANYSVDVIRGVGTMFDPILIQEKLPVSAADGAGRCFADDWTKRRMNTEAQDPGQNVSVITASHTILFQAGTYTCRVLAPAFKVNSHKVRLQAKSGNWPMGGLAPESPAIGAPMKNGFVTLATLETVFTLAAPEEMQVEHWCENDSMDPAGGGTTNTSFQFGYSFAPPGYYSGDAIYATLSCFRTS